MLLQGYTCLQAASLFTEAGLSQRRFRGSSDFHGASLPPREVSDTAGSSFNQCQKRVWQSGSLHALNSPRLIDRGCFNDRSQSLDQVQPLLLRLGKKVQAGKSNVPGAYVFYALASFFPKAEIISAYDRRERPGSAMPVICEGAHPTLLPLNINAS